MAKRSFSVAEREEILSAYQKSKEPNSVFCSRINLSQSTLYNWLGKAKKKKQKTHKISAPVRILPVQSPAPMTCDSVELKISRGMVLSFSVGASADYVVSIVKALS